MKNECARLIFLNWHALFGIVFCTIFTGQSIHLLVNVRENTNTLRSFLPVTCLSRSSLSLIRKPLFQLQTVNTICTQDGFLSPFPRILGWSEESREILKPRGKTIKSSPSFSISFPANTGLESRTP